MPKRSLRPGRDRWTIILSHASGLVVLCFAPMWLRGLAQQPDPIQQGNMQVTAGLFAFVFASVTLVRFQGTQDRISLILGSGFLLSGSILAASGILFFQLPHDLPEYAMWAPIAWWVSRLTLALLLLVAPLVEHFLPRSRHPKREIGASLLTVIGLTYLITVAFHHLPPEVARHPGAFVPSPQQLLPAIIFLAAMVWYRIRLKTERSAFDRAIFAAAWMNLAAQLAASQSQRLLDSPFVFAQALTVGSYGVALIGALLDNARLFEQVRNLAVSDPLTGLANYRRFLDVLDAETERTNRTGRPFAVLLMDLDGLKHINDTYGHIVGSRALCRVADILRIHCRTIDTAVRYGGDEFALVLPESQETEAHSVATRIQEVMAADTEEPPISASVGVAVYRGKDERVEKLLSEADKHLYASKARSRGRRSSGAKIRKDTPRPRPV